MSVLAMSASSAHQDIPEACIWIYGAHPGCAGLSGCGSSASEHRSVTGAPSDPINSEPVFEGLRWPPRGMVQDQVEWQIEWQNRASGCLSWHVSAGVGSCFSWSGV